MRGVDKTIKFYNGEDYVQSFTSHEVILEWIQQFLELSPADLIIWNRQGEKGIYTPYSEERLVTLLKLLLSDQVV